MEEEDFAGISEQLNRLRSAYLETQTRSDDSIPTKLGELSERQSECFGRIKEFVSAFLEDRSLQEYLANETSFISLPGRDSVRDLNMATKAVLQIYSEMADIKACEDLPVDRIRSRLRKMLARCQLKELNDADFNKKLQNISHYLRASGDMLGANMSGDNTELGEDFCNSTINTIVSDDVMASSPF